MYRQVRLAGPTGQRGGRTAGQEAVWTHMLSVLSFSVFVNPRSALLKDDADLISRLMSRLASNVFEVYPHDGHPTCSTTYAIAPGVRIYASATLLKVGTKWRRRGWGMNR